MKAHLCLLCLLLIFPSGDLWAQSSKTTYEKLVTHYVRQNYRNPKLILSVIKRESSFDIHAKNGHCIGLMQVNSSVWFSKDPKYNLIKLGVLKSKKDLYNWKLNIKAGAYILKFYGYDYRKYRGKR
jgi:soluble lytic murein transglycosylase-like protein